MDDDVFFRLFYFKVICHLWDDDDLFFLLLFEVSFVFRVSLLTFDHPLLFTRSALFLAPHKTHTHLFIVKPNYHHGEQQQQQPALRFFLFSFSLSLSLSLSLSFFCRTSLYSSPRKEEAYAFTAVVFCLEMDVSFSKRRCGL